MTHIKAKFVTFNGSINIGGMNAQNLDAARDGCELHLHQETGGVLVKRGEDCFYVSPVAITSVELYDMPYLGTKKELTDEEAETPFWNKDAKRGDAVGTFTHNTALDPEAVAKGARNLADEVLAQLGDDSRTTSNDVPKPRRARTAKLKIPGS